MKSSTSQAFTAQTLSLSEAIVLQQVHEDGEDDANSLSQALGMSKKSTLHTITHLRRRGLIAVDADYGDVWVHVTRKGLRLIRYLWPEAHHFTT
jgi:DNA-binding MarR family transcriptional regulator